VVQQLCTEFLAILSIALRDAFGMNVGFELSPE
jgi:hypothetical protein